MVVRSQAGATLRSLLAAATSSAASTPRWLSQAAKVAGDGPGGSSATQGVGTKAGSPPQREVDPQTGLPLSAPPPRTFRDTIEEVTIYQLEELLAAGSGAAADPDVRRAAEEALEAIAVCESRSQELDAAGQWESLLSSAGMINSARDYGVVEGAPEAAPRAGSGGGGRRRPSEPA